MVYRTIKCGELQEDMWGCNIEELNMNRLKINNQFLKDVLISWNSFNRSVNRRIENQYIWHNSVTKIGPCGPELIWHC